MKTFKVTVIEEKEKFFLELMKNLGLAVVSFSSQDENANFMHKNKPVTPPPSYELDEEARKKAAKVREDSLKDVIGRIEQLRKR